MANTKPTQKSTLVDNDVKSTEETIDKTIQTELSVSKSRRKTSLDEFALVNNLRPEHKAGFAAWLKNHGGNFHFNDEWDDLYIQYTNR